MGKSEVMTQTHQYKNEKGPGVFFKRVYRYRYLLIMLLPATVFVLLFSYLPMTGIVLAFKKFNYAAGIYKSPWNGLNNFKFLIISKKLWPLTRNTLLYNIAFISTGIVVQVSLAVMLNEIVFKRFQKVSQAIIMLPYFISWVVVSTMFVAFFGYEQGIIGNLMVRIGLEKINLTITKSVWPFLLVFFNLWKNQGYGTVVYLASITGIDQEMYDAAEVDGANVWQRIRYITLPCLKPTVIIMMLLAFGNAFRGDFSMFYQLVGSNARILEVADILDLFIYRVLISNNDIGLSSATGLYQSVLCFAAIVTMNGVIKKIDPDYSLF